MTKGVLISLFKDSVDNEKIVVFTSPQYNGDMGYDQRCGKIAMERLYGMKTVKTYEKILLDFVYKFKYLDPPEKNRIDFIPYDGILTNCGKSLDKPYVIDKKILIHELKYSDYAYIVNCLDTPFYYVDMNNEKHLLVPNAEEVAVLHYGYYIGSMMKRNGIKTFTIMKDKKDWPEDIRSC